MPTTALPDPVLCTSYWTLHYYSDVKDSYGKDSDGKDSDVKDVDAKDINAKDSCVKDIGVILY